MIRHILGEALSVGSVLTWGPGYYYQKQFFEGRDNSLSTPDHLMRYDLEVSGFPSSFNGHLVLLELKDQNYPGTRRPRRLADVGSTDSQVGEGAGRRRRLRALRAGAWQVKGNTLPTDEMPPFDGIGANEYVVDVAHDAVDFISTDRHAAVVGAERLVPHAQRRVPHAHQRRDRLPVHLRRPRRPRPQLRAARQAVVRRDGPRGFATAGPTSPTARATSSTSASTIAMSAWAAASCGCSSRARCACARSSRRGSTSALMPVIRSSSRRREAVLGSRTGAHRRRTRRGGRARRQRYGRCHRAYRRRRQGAGSRAFPLAIERSSWVALRILPSSHTNPIFVVVGGPAGPGVARQRRVVPQVGRSAVEPEIPQIAPRERDAAAAAYEQARAVYRQRLAETSAAAPAR